MPPLWDYPHHWYRGAIVIVGAMAGVACAEWNVHAWDLARSLGTVYRPADPEIVFDGWWEGTTQVRPAEAAAGSLPGGGARSRSKVEAWAA